MCYSVHTLFSTHIVLATSPIIVATFLLCVPRHMLVGFTATFSRLRPVLFSLCLRITDVAPSLRQCLGASLFYLFPLLLHGPMVLVESGLLVRDFHSLFSIAFVLHFLICCSIQRFSSTRFFISFVVFLDFFYHHILDL